MSPYEYHYKVGEPFNPFIYNPNDPESIKRFRFDWATNQIEHGRGNPTRVVPFTEITIFSTKKVYAADERYGFVEVENTPHDPLYEGTRNLFSLLTDPANYVDGVCNIVHLSPPDPKIGFPSGRITIYSSVMTSSDCAEITAYGSIGCEKDWKDYQTIGYQLAGVSFPTAKQMRDFPLLINTKGEHFLSYLSKELPQLSQDWEDINSGLALEFFAKVLSETENLTEAEIKGMIATGMLGIAHDSMKSAGRSADFGDTQCPTGIGVSSSGGWIESETCPKVHCPKCGWEPDSMQKKELGKTITSCPGKNNSGCGWKPGDPV